jgi:hypothetical protein
MNRRRSRALAQCSVNPALTVPALTLVMVLKALSAALEVSRFYSNKVQEFRARALSVPSGLARDVRPNCPQSDRFMKPPLDGHKLKVRFHSLRARPSPRRSGRYGSTWRGLG